MFLLNKTDQSASPLVRDRLKKVGFPLILDISQANFVSHRFMPEAPKSSPPLFNRSPSLLRSPPTRIPKPRNLQPSNSTSTLQPEMSHLVNTFSKLLGFVKDDQQPSNQTTETIKSTEVVQEEISACRSPSTKSKYRKTEVIVQIPKKSPIRQLDLLKDSKSDALKIASVDEADSPFVTKENISPEPEGPGNMRVEALKTLSDAYDRIITSSPKRIRSTNVILPRTVEVVKPIPPKVVVTTPPVSTGTVSLSGSNLFSPNFTHADEAPHDDKGKDTVLHEEIPEDIHHEEDEEEFYEAITFIATLPSRETLPEHPARPRSSIYFDDSAFGLVPPKAADDHRLTLVLDLDETLVHCAVGELHPCDTTFEITIPSRSTPFLVSVRWRPYLFEFFEKIRDKYEVIIFTASQKVYADKLLDMIDPDHSVIAHRLFRDSCRYVNGNFMKDLQVLDRDLRRTVIVDNAPQAFGYQVSNGYHIQSWYDNPKDQALKDLLVVLDEIDSFSDIRPYIRGHFPLFQRIMKYRDLYKISTSFELDAFPNQQTLQSLYK